MKNERQWHSSYSAFHIFVAVVYRTVRSLLGRTLCRTGNNGPVSDLNSLSSPSPTLSPGWSLRHNRWFHNQCPPFFSVLHCPLRLNELKACPFLDVVVFPRLVLSACCLLPLFSVPCKMVWAKPGEREKKCRIRFQRWTVNQGKCIVQTIKKHTWGRFRGELSNEQEDVHLTCKVWTKEENKNWKRFKELIMDK